jgi:hypothetical protein
MDFTVANIQYFMMSFFSNAEEIMLEAMEKLFDKISSASNKNQMSLHGLAGYKTNDGFKLKKKVILPNWLCYDPSWVSRNARDGFKSWRSDERERFDDLDKIMLYLDGYRKGPPAAHLSLNLCFDLWKKEVGEISDPIHSTYFKLKVHKIGTAHIWFKRKDLLKKFNRTIAQRRKWLNTADAASCAEQREKQQRQENVSGPVVGVSAPRGGWKAGQDLVGDQMSLV